MTASVAASSSASCRAACLHPWRRPFPGSCGYNAAAAFWNALASHTELIKAEIESDRDAFKPLLNDLADELEHLADLKARIASIRAAKKETPDGPLH